MAVPGREVWDQFRTLLANESSECSRDVTLVAEGILNRQTWALQMLDALGKPGSGLMQGEVQFLGSFQQCLDVVSPDNVTSPPRSLHGQYCLATVMPNAQSPIARVLVGLCVPQTCGEIELRDRISELVETLTNRSMPVLVTCQDPNKELDSSAVAVISVLALFGLLLVLGTVYDVLLLQLPKWRHEDSERETAKADVVHADQGRLEINQNKDVQSKQDDSVWGRLLVSFSVYTNGQKLLNTKQPPGSLTAVHGVRFISMTWVLLGHTLVFGNTHFAGILPFEKTIFGRWTYLTVVNASVSVDSFFLLSGLLVGYLLMKEMEKEGSWRKVKWGMFYFHRFWRLTPPYMLVIMTYVPLFVYFGSGPYWPKNGIDIYCKDNWWTNLLYINNLVHADQQCMVWSWYLANDMQFYILSPLILIPLFILPAAGLVVAALFLVTTVVTASVISQHYGLPAGLGIGLQNLAQDETNQNAMLEYYYKPYCRMGPYLIGLLTGFLLQRTKCKVKMTRIQNLLGWSAAAAICLSIIYGLWPQAQGTVLPVGVTAFYNGVHRTAWGVGLAWVVFACATGHGGFVNTLLSWKALVPLSRLTYCCYLIHPVVCYAFYMSQKGLISISDIQYVYLFFGNLLTTYLVAVVTSLTFEAPMLGLEKVIFHKS